MLKPDIFKSKKYQIKDASNQEGLGWGSEAVLFKHFYVPETIFVLSHVLNAVRRNAQNCIYFDFINNINLSGSKLGNNH